MKIKSLAIKAYAIATILLAVIMVTSTFAGAVGLVSKTGVVGSFPVLPGFVSGSSSSSGSSVSSSGSGSSSSGNPGGGVGTLDDPNPYNQPPSCNIDSITPNPAQCNKSGKALVKIVGTGSDPENGPKYFWWDFNGDGTWDICDYGVDGFGDVSDTEYYNYSVPPGYNSYTYNVVLRVYDALGAYDEDTKTVTVTAYPVAIISAPGYGDANKTITFSGSNSYDPNGQIVNWYWDFGDGETGYGQIVNHIYTKGGGTKTVTLTVTDNDGFTGEVQVTISIRELIFDIHPDPAYPIPLGDEISFNVTVKGFTPSSYDWNFGEEGAPHGYTQAVEHSYSNEGYYTVNLTVTDSKPNREKISGIVIVHILNENTDPSDAVHSKPAPAELLGGTEVAFDGSASYCDNPNDFIPTNNYIWYFGDGEKGYGVNTTHKYQNPGNYMTTLKVISNVCSRDSKQTSVIIPNDFNSGASPSDQGSSSQGSYSYYSGSSSAGYTIISDFMSMCMKSNILQYRYFVIKNNQHQPTAPLGTPEDPNVAFDFAGNGGSPIDTIGSPKVNKLDIHVIFYGIPDIEASYAIYQDPSMNNLLENGFIQVYNDSIDNKGVGNVAITFDWPAGTARYVMIYLDSDFTYNETNEDDNWWNSSFTPPLSNSYDYSSSSISQSQSSDSQSVSQSTSGSGTVYVSGSTQYGTFSL